MGQRLSIIVVLGSLIAPCCAQTFTYPNFSSTTGLTLNNHAAQAGSVLRVTPNLISQRGSAWYDLPVPVASGFETTFTFQITALSSGGADGLVFVIHNDPRNLAALGNHAGALGYGAFATAPAGTAIANSLAIELDTFQGPFGGFTDLSGNEISVHTGGSGDNSQSEGFSLGRISPTVNMSNLAVHTVKIRYFPGQLEIYLDSATPTLTVPYNFTIGGTHVLPNTPVGGLNLLPGGQAIVGFVASSGASWENHDILSWTFTSFESSLSGSVGVSAGPPTDVLLINGTAGGLGRSVAVSVGQPITIDVIVPPASGLVSANHLIMFDTCCPQVGGSLVLPFGTLAFLPPLPGFPATSFVLFDTFGLGLGTLVPASPAPFTFSLPAGLPAPLQLILQGIIADTPGPISVTNAVTLKVQ